MIEIVIKIEEETYNRIMNGWMPLHKAVNLMENVQKGTPLPEHHGRIIDESKINKVFYNTEEAICNNIKAINTTIVHTDAPTIIEAEKGDSE
jgi:hypothetical protein